jgi:hypothetical protein
MLFFIFFQFAKKELVVYAFQPSKNLIFFFISLFFVLLFHFLFCRFIWLFNYFIVSSNKFTFNYLIIRFFSLFFIVIHNIKSLIKGIGRFIR